MKRSGALAFATLEGLGMMQSQLLLERESDEAMEMGAHVKRVLAVTKPVLTPFRHWLLEGVLPQAVCREIAALPIAPAMIRDTLGKRNSHDEVRVFFSPELQARHAVMRQVAEAFQREDVTDAIEECFDASLEGGSLRIEYCQDGEEFWLEPHIDIKEKYITLQIYLNDGPDAETLGTDLYDAKKQPVSRASARMGQGLVFLSSEPESWHGFEKRPIQGIRRSLIINYVTEDWRARHELAFPGRPVAARAARRRLTAGAR